MHLRVIREMAGEWGGGESGYPNNVISSWFFFLNQSR